VYLYVEIEDGRIMKLDSDGNLMTSAASPSPTTPGPLTIFLH